jgi:hypothetical protein
MYFQKERPPPVILLLLHRNKEQIIMIKPGKQPESLENWGVSRFSTIC